MRLRALLLCLTILVPLLAAGCAGGGGGGAGTSAPTTPGASTPVAVESLLVTAGPAGGGTKLEIIGRGFFGNLRVMVGGRECTDVHANTEGTRITAMTPSAATSITVADVLVISDTNGQAQAPIPFQYQPPPTLASVSPIRGSMAGGLSVTISGTNFLGTVTVSFGGKAATGVTASPDGTRVVCTTPGFATEASVDVVVESSLSGKVTAAGGFTFFNPTPAFPPTVSSVIPNHGAQSGGTQLTISGQNFRGVVGVTVGGSAAANVFVNSSGTLITCNTPVSATAGAKNVVVTNGDGTSATVASAFTYDPPMSISSVSPASGPSSGGTLMTIDGTQFTGTLFVRIGGQPAASVTVNGPRTRITCVTPPASQGATVDVEVLSDTNGSALRTAAFTYVDPPLTVTGLSPDNGPLAGNTLLTINGTAFIPPVTVTVDGLVAAQVVVDGNQRRLTCRTPPGAGAGPVDVVVASPVNGAGTLFTAFRYNALPAITSVTPANGPLSGGAPITIAGSSFLGTPGVTIDGVACSNVSVNAQGTVITCNTPAALNGTGSKTLTVNSLPSGTATAAYTYNPLPSISTVAPANGFLEGGTAVVLTGGSFEGTVNVSIDGVPAAVTSVNGARTQVSLLTPPGFTLGAVDVELSASLSGQTLLPGAFTYDPNPPPAVTTVVPAAGPQDGGTPIVITGANFHGSLTVQIDGDFCSGVTVNTSGTRIDCVTPPSRSGDGGKTLEIISDTHGSIAVGNGFTYNPFPTVATITPASGPQTGGNTVVIDGTGFGGTVAVRLGQFACSGVTVNASQTQITCLSAGETSEGDFDVEVTSSTHGRALLELGYHFNRLPQVLLVTPNNGPLSGSTNVTIDGADFGGTVNVTLDGRPCTNVSVSAALDRITCSTPGALAPGAKRLDVGSSTNGPASLLNAFTYNATPTITAVTPSNGPEQGGTSIAIDGTGFAGTVNVTIGTAAAANLVVNGAGTRVTCDTPRSPDGGGARDVIVTSDATGVATRLGGFTYNPSPTIASVAPASGPTAGGTAVTILGTNFLGTVTVKFGTLAAQSVTVNATATQIDCVTAASALAGAVDVTVTSSTNGTQVRSAAYTYVPPGPFFPSIVPNEGPRGVRTPVVLTGFNMLGTVTVSFGGASALNVTANPSGTQVTCETNDVPVLTGPVDVVLTSSTNGVTTSSGGFRFNLPPSISSLVPDNGPQAGGNPVVIFGSDFRGTVTVTVDGVSATGVTANVTGDRITFTPPAGASTGGKTVVVTCSASGTVSGVYTYNPEPTVTSVAPPAGKQDGGDALTILGTNYFNTVTVSIDGAQAANVVPNGAGDTITCNAPAAITGPGPKRVLVTSSTHGTSTNVSGTYIYNPRPVITSVTPGSGPLGGSNNVTIDGLGFLGTVNVTIDNQAAPTVSVSSTEIIATVPASTTGTGGKVLTVDTSLAGPVSLNPGYTYNPPPTISALAPGAGSMQGGTTVVILGSFFGGTVNVTFGAAAATNVVVNGSKTQITCRTPASGFAGLVDVTVTASANGTVTRSLAFDYQPVPTVQVITPNQGPVAGGTNVTITGTNFGGTVTVDLEGTPCTAVNVNAARTQITCVTGASINGACSGTPCKDVHVVSSLNGAGTLVDGFQYNPPPIIVGPIVPNNGPLEGGTPITIAGARFDGTISVSIDGVLCTGVVVTGNTTISCITPPARAGVGFRDVVVFSDRNGPVTRVNGFRYNEQLTVIEIVPNEGPVAGGTTINITGTFFGTVPNPPPGGTGLTVTIDGAPCTGVTVNASQTVITCVTPPSPNAPPDDVGPKTVVVHSDRNGTAVVPNGFTYRPLPTFLGINPNNGPLAGGTNIAIDGTDFRGTVNVIIDGAFCTGVTVNASATQLTCFTPPSPSGIGPKDVVVNSTGSGSVTQTAGFTYNPTPTLTLVTPDQGPVAGGNTITIDGTGFRDTVNVSIDNVLCTNVTPNVTGTSMTLTVPASTSGEGPKLLGIDSSRDGISFFANAYTYRNTPTFLVVTPNNGPEAGGQAIAITGTNFFGVVSVTIDGAACTNVTVTAAGDRVDCVTPASPSGLGAKDVVVTASASGAVTGFNAYRYNPAPTVITVVPDNGPLGGGTRIAITGTNFLNTVTVSIAGNACTNLTVNATGTRVDCDVPASTSGAGGKALTVTSSSNGSVNLFSGFTYNSTPTITSLAPAEGPLVGGNVIFINGTDFRGTMTVTIDGVSAPVVTQSTTFTFVSVTVPASTTGTGPKNVVVNATLAGAVTAVGVFTYNPLPTFTGVSPDNGPQGGGTLITVTGDTFRGGTQVLVGGVPCTNVVVSGTSDSLTCRTPQSPNGTGVRDLVVGCTLSGTVTQANAYTYNPSPTVISIVPSNGPEGGGTAIAITGADFRGTVAVTIDGAACTGVTVDVSATRIDCVTPPSVSGPGSKDVQISASLSGTILIPNGFVYNITPGLVSIVPNEGPNQGGQQVLITGTDFGGTIGVRFGPNAGTVNAVSPDSTRITATTPPRLGFVGLVDLGIYSSVNGNVTFTSAYTYNAPPTFGTITPAEGPLSGGTPVVILGTLFRGAVQVFIGGNPCTGVTVNATATRIDAVTPAGSLGLQPVQVVSSLNGQVTIANAFLYNPGPTITSVVDNNGPLPGGQTINIFGTGFGGTLNVTIDGVPCTNVTATVAEDRITCVTPAAATGAGPKTLSVQSSTNGIVNLASGFTYNGPPTLTNVNPPDGPAAGGQTVILTGTGLNPTVNVSFGNVPAQVLSVNATNTQITVRTPPLPVGQNPPQTVGVTVNSTFTGAVTLAGSYTYNVTPTVTLINPNNGPLGGGQQVIITGANFRGQVGVRIDGAPATNVVVNGGFNQITLRTPPGQAPIPVDVAVDSSLNGTTIVPLGYSYNNTPTASNMVPAEGPAAGGTQVTIAGAGFLPTVNVIFDTSFASGVTVNATFTQVRATSPSFTRGTPAALGTSVPVTVSSSGAGDIPAPVFTFNVTPTLVQLNPQTGPAQGGQLVILRGNIVQSLASTTGATVQVLIGGAPATGVTFVNDALGPGVDEIRFTTPPGTLGAQDLTVISSTHGTTTFPGRYTYNTAPTLGSITPNNGPMAGGTSVVIVGTGFDPTINVTIGGLPATGIVVTGNTTITAQTPAVATPGGRDVLVQSTQNGTVTATNGFTYNNTPTISSIVPNNGPVAGGQLVDINGAGFGGTVTVQLGAVTVPSQNVTVAGGVITVLTPPGGAAGPVNVTVSSSQFGTTVVPSGYTFNPAPTITAVTPDNGPVNAATAITITGTNFLAPSTVTIGGQTAGLTTVVSPTQITATAQAFTLVGGQDVVVTSNRAGIATFADGFTYTPVFSSSSQATPAGGAPSDVATGDFNGDGVQDFVVANQFANSFSIFISGTRTDFAVTGSEPGNVAVADMDRDGKPDVITTNKVSNDMNVFLNVMALPTNTPTFTAPVVLAMAGTPGAVEARDINGDGRPDVVTVAESTGDILVRLNTTSPGGGLNLSTFAQITAGLSSPAGFAMADFDRDGLPDLAIAESAAGANRAQVYRNTTGPGGSSPAFSQLLTLGCGTRAVAVAAGDLNGDGRPDLVVANRQDDTFSTFLASGTVGTVAFTAQPVQTTGAGPVAIAIADLDGAGVPDVITANDGDSSVSVRVNQTVPGATSVTYSAQADRACGQTPGTLLVLDVNNDGKRDLVLPNRTQSTVTTLSNTTPMGSTPAALATRQDFATTNGGNPQAVVAADFNLDGKTDIVTLKKNGAAAERMEIFTNTTAVNAQTFTWTQAVRATDPLPIAMAVGDLNYDGKPDLVVVTESDTLQIFFNSSTGPTALVTFNEATPVPAIVSAGELPRGVAIGDFNGDGKNDIAVSLLSVTQRVRIVANNTTVGAGQWTSGAQFDMTGVSSDPASMAAGDLNGDGYPDLVTGNLGSNSVQALRNGKGQDGPSLSVTFSAMSPTAVGAGPLAVRIGDVSGDGRPDVLTVANASSISLVRNATTGGNAPAFDSPALTSGVSGPTSLDLGELNGDGRLDVATSNGGDDTASVFLNQAGAFPAGLLETFNADVNPQGVAIGDFNNDYRPDVAVINFGANRLSVLRNITIP